MLRSIDFIDSLNEPLSNFVPKKAADPHLALLELEKHLPFEDPDKYPCTFSSRLMQVSILNKGKTFGDTNLQKDWPGAKLNEKFESE